MVEGRLAAARVSLLFRFVRQASLGGAAAGGVLVLLLWPTLPAALLLSWLATLLVAMAVRLVIQSRYGRSGEPAADALAWERRFSLATFAIGAVWAYLPAALFPEGNALLQTAVVVLIAAVMMAGAGLYAASARVVHSFVLLPMSAMVVSLAVQDSSTHRVLAVTMAVFTLVIIRVAGEIRRSLVEALHARLEHETLLATLRESEEKLRLAVEAADLDYWEWDRESGLIRSGSDARTWDDYRERVHPEDQEHYLAAVEAAWKQGTPYSAEYRVLGRDGRVSWISARGKAIRDAAGRAKRMIGVAQDVTERRQQDDTVRFLAYHDALTGLPNRRLLEDRLKQALYRAQRRAGSVAVLLIDLDDFKQVNDSAGHRAGDAVLREIAMRLSGCVRKADTLARHGGDEFVVVMGDLEGDADCQAVAEKIHRALAPEVRLDDARTFSLGASIGIAVSPGDAEDGDALLRNADAAMYRAKQLGRNQYRFYGR